MSSTNLAEVLRLLEGVNDRILNLETTINKQIMRMNAVERIINRSPDKASLFKTHFHPYSNVDHSHTASESGFNVVDDVTPQLGGDLDLNGNDLLPGSAGGSDLGSATLEFGALYLDEGAGTGLYLGLDQDIRLYNTGNPGRLKLEGNFASHFAISAFTDYFFSLTEKFIIEDVNDADVDLFVLDTTARTLTIGPAADPIDTTHHGNYLMGGTGGDDERLRVPYLTGVPASVDNGSIWMEADGLHIYWNGAEKLVAGV